MNTGDLILEIGTEEMPSASIDEGISQLKSKAEKLLCENRLSFSEVRTYGTPRRLALNVIGLHSQQLEEVKETKGPPAKLAFNVDGKPTAAAKGFAKSQGVNVADLEVRETPEGVYIYATTKEKGKKTLEILPDILPRLISSISFRKSMRWQGDNICFVRPIRWLLALYEDKIVSFSFGNLKSSNLTWGHRFLAKNPIEVKSCKEYLPLLQAAKVIVNQEKRKEIIQNDIKKLLKKKEEKPVINPKTFTEVINLVESPHAICGTFSDDYLSLPREVLATSMESHQRYFPIDGIDGKLKSKFIVVHNGNAAYDDNIRKGHEKVLRARLADAKFFFEEDKKEPFAQNVEKLKGVIFQDKLGTMHGKVKRIEEVANFLAKKLRVENSTKDNAKRVAYLSKADLVTEMVIEFPDLQGVMGREYAALSGENKEVAEGIFEHYLPRYSGDILPKTDVGKIVSIADKIDTIVGCFSVGFLPTGSEDPYALRRQAQGIISIILNGELNLSPFELIEFALSEYKKEKIEFYQDEAQILKELKIFFLGRLKQQFLSAGFQYDVIDSVLALGLNNLVVLREKIKIMSKYREESLIKDLFTAFIRCKNLAVGELGTAVNENLFKQEEERTLFWTILQSEKAINKSLKDDDYEEVMKILANLRPFVDKFFDEVLVMAKEKELRDNRVKLLNKCVQVFETIADFSKLAIAAG
ncbi:glycine--tRNA ligase subunit beta [Candidatus Oleimmundimicrobium sp.]|uniref:glycine--tRNA ligase subunit beta n=1 Tax=Candidatus Oleimmundimicrobium sp. TaxID=3060597 RepID=UPI00271C40B0|nr:glycine--tRNA ligase subunit beta [Candidatus Oleimmundimicrobium sp.]MDO8885833.1 glycine--tRNA ligase subunit beta [Candidatus Oleimmundimicrobium sp.]